MKKIIALALALIMILGLATTASAEGEVTEPTATTYSITINNSKPGHIYEAYQIFTGDLFVTGEGENISKVLSNIAWGSGITAEGKAKLGNAETVAKSLENEADAIAFSKNAALYLSNVVAGSDNAPEDDKYVIDIEEPGYYLVKDQNNSLNGENDVYTRYIVKVVGEAVVSPKSSAPSVQKKVDDINDSNTTEDEVEWKDSADHDITDHVPFQLKATLGTTVEDYLKYKVVFHDTLSKGMYYDQGSYEVYLGEGENRKKVTEHFKINVGEYSETTGTEITFTCENVKAFGATNSSVIVVEYTATLNDKANIGAPGNPNEVYLEYSNNPNWAWEKWGDSNGDGIIDENDEPTVPPTNPGDDGKDNDNDDKIDEDDEDWDEPTGNTPVDKVIVFTYKVSVDKVNEANAALPGAEFTLEKFVASENGTTTFKGVKGDWVTKTLVKNADGTVFSFEGMDDGEYRITETKAPAGYNSVAPIYFKVEATHTLDAAEPKLESLTVTVTKEDGTAYTEAEMVSGNIANFDVTLTDGQMKTTVVNKAGVELPETGGMGTTLFYIIGGLLVAGAAILLITKKRMSANY